VGEFMLEKDFAIIAVRLLALYIVVMTVNSLPAYLGMIGSKISMDPMSRVYLISSIIGTALHFIVAIALWFYSTSLADLITKGLSETVEPSEGFTLDRIQVVAVSMVGIFVLSSGIPEFFRMIISYLFPELNPRYLGSISSMGKVKGEIPVVDLVMVAVKLGMGFWLLLGSNGIVAAVRAIWAKGKPYSELG
jgi:hypothetical protein